MSQVFKKALEVLPLQGSTLAFNQSVAEEMAKEKQFSTCTCQQCRRNSDLDAAINAGWIPSYWEVTQWGRSEGETCEVQWDGPVCPDCQEQLNIRMDPETGEYTRFLRNLIIPKKRFSTFPVR